MSSVSEREIAPQDCESAATDASESVVGTRDSTLSSVRDSLPPGHSDEYAASLRANNDGRHAFVQRVFSEHNLLKENFELKQQLQSVERHLQQECKQHAATHWELKEKAEELQLVLSANEKLRAQLQKSEDHWTSLVEEQNKKIEELKRENEELKALLAKQKDLVDKLSSTFWKPRDYAVETATQVLSTLIPDTRWNELPEKVPVQVLWILIQSSIHAEEFAGVMSLAEAVCVVYQANVTLECVGTLERETFFQLNEICTKNKDQMSLQKSLYKLSNTTEDKDTLCQSKINLPEALRKAFFDLVEVDCKEFATRQAACDQLYKSAQTYDGARAINVLYTAQREVVKLTRRTSPARVDGGGYS